MPMACFCIPLFRPPQSGGLSCVCCRSILQPGTTRRGERDEHILPDAFLRPTNEPVIECLLRSVAGGSSRPPVFRRQDVNDAADDTTVVHPRNTTNLASKNGRNRASCASVNQNSLTNMLLQSQNLNHIAAALGIPFMRTLGVCLRGHHTPSSWGALYCHTLPPHEYS